MSKVSSIEDSSPGFRVVVEKRYPGGEAEPGWDADTTLEALVPKESESQDTVEEALAFGFGLVLGQREELPAAHPEGVPMWVEFTVKVYAGDDGRDPVATAGWMGRFDREGGLYVWEVRR